MIGLLNCPITNFPKTTCQVNQWKLGVFQSNHNRGNCDFFHHNDDDNDKYNNLELSIDKG